MRDARDAGWLQTPLLVPEITWTAPDLATLPAWCDAKRICLDVECRDDDLTKLGPGVRRGGYVCGIGFAIEDGPAYYLPIRHQGGGNLDPQRVWAYLRDNAAIFMGDVVFNSAPYDLDYLWENGVVFPRAQWIRDVQVAEPLLDELQLTYGLDAIAARRGLPGKDERELDAHAKAWGVHKKKGLWRLHAGAVGRYAEQDVRLPLQVLRRQERELEEQELGKVYDLESRVTPALVRMTRRGLRIDLDKLDRVEAWATQRLQDYLDQIYHLTGVRVGSISNARELYPALKQRGLDVPVPVHAGTGKETPSITKLWLAQQDDDVTRAIISGREFVKLLTTYVAGYRKHMVGDRIYASFKQLHSASDDDEEEDEGARFGRCAAKHPNVHAQMKRSKEIQKKWREVHCANEGTNIYEADYCYSADTEVLTPQGWVRFAAYIDQELTDTIAQWEGGEITFVAPTARYRSAYTGDLVQVDACAVKFAVTPNHDLVFADTRGDTRKVRADQLDGVPDTWNFVSAGRLGGGVTEDPNVLRLVVAIQADATDRGTAWRFWLSRQDKIDRAAWLLDQLGIPFTRGFSPAKGNQTSFQFRHDDRVAKYLTTTDKTFKLSALLELDGKSRELFLTGLAFWDGCRATGAYLSTNLVNCEIVQMLAILTQRRSNFTVRHPGGTRKPLGVVQLSRRWYSTVQTSTPNSRGARRLESAARPYDGNVYCVSVPSGAIVTRYRGAVVILANSQQEPRTTVHYAEICRLPGAAQAAQRYRDNPMQDSYDLMLELLKWPRAKRDEVKELYLGRCYGMGGGKMAKKLGLPTMRRTNTRDGRTYEAAGPEAQEILDAFDAGVPYVRALAKRCETMAKARGYLISEDGRRLRFPLDSYGNVDWTYKALNRLIQGRSAGQTKTALVDLDAAGLPLDLTVHDSFRFCGDDDARGFEMAEIMRNALPMRVPVRVDLTRGQNYGELKTLEAV